MWQPLGHVETSPDGSESFRRAPLAASRHGPAPGLPAAAREQPWTCAGRAGRPASAGRAVCFQFLAVLNAAVINLFVHDSAATLNCFQGQIPGRRITGSQGEEQLLTLWIHLVRELPEGRAGCRPGVPGLPQHRTSHVAVVGANRVSQREFFERESAGRPVRGQAVSSSSPCRSPCCPRSCACVHVAVFT